MKIVNADVPMDLCQTAVEEALLELKSKDLSRVVLLASSSYGFSYIYDLAVFFKEENPFGFSLTNIDTSPVLAKDSWMLIDYSTDTMFYSKGA